MSNETTEALEERVMLEKKLRIIFKNISPEKVRKIFNEAMEDGRYENAVTIAEVCNDRLNLSKEDKDKLRAGFYLKGSLYQTRVEGLGLP
jgi:hypothetical protein